MKLKWYNLPHPPYSLDIGPVDFYFRATLGVKEVLQSSKKFNFDFFMIFYSTSLPQSKNVF